MSIVIVRWEDTTNIADWSTPDEVAEFAVNGSWVCENVGWVVYEDGDCVVLAGRRTVDGKNLGLFERIPKRAVVAQRPVGDDTDRERSETDGR